VARRITRKWSGRVAHFRVVRRRVPQTTTTTKVVSSTELPALTCGGLPMRMPGSRATAELGLAGPPRAFRAAPVGPQDSWPHRRAPCRGPQPQRTPATRPPCTAAPHLSSRPGARPGSSMGSPGRAITRRCTWRRRPLTSVWSCQPLAPHGLPASRAAVFGLDSNTRGERRASGAAAAQTGVVRR
jgi:hypothetical protein